MLRCATGLIELCSFSGLANPGLAEGQHSQTFENSLIGRVVVMAILLSVFVCLFVFLIDWVAEFQFYKTYGQG